MSSLEESAIKTRTVMAEMTGELEKLRLSKSQSASLNNSLAADGSGVVGTREEWSTELSALQSERSHLLAYTELLQSRVDEMAKEARPQRPTRPRVR